MGAGEGLEAKFSFFEETAMFPQNFPANERPATALTVAGRLDLENQRYPRRASEWVAVTRDCDHSRKSGVSSMVDWGGNPT